jgi:hypothetical protein
MKKVIVLLVVSLLFIQGDAYAKKKLYKWIDEDGNITYSDQVPPNQIKKKHEEISDNGVVLEKIGNAKTKEEFLAEKEIKRKELEAEKLAKEKEIIRKNILKAYSSESEITRLKDERIYALEKNIDLANQNLEFQKISKEQLLSMAADNERNGKNVSKALKSRIKIIEDKIKYQLKFIQAKTDEKNLVKLKFENDLKIYRNAKKGGH